MSNQSPFPARVAEVLDPTKVVINRGSRDGVKVGQCFLVYTLSSSPIIDPVTQEDLGHLEIVRGIGRVSHLQDRLATLVNSRRARRTRQVYMPHDELFRRLAGYPDALTTVEEEDEVLPFDNAAVGDLARPI